MVQQTDTGLMRSGTSDVGAPETNSSAVNRKQRPIHVIGSPPSRDAGADM